MGMGIHKQINGAVSNGHVPHVETGSSYTQPRTSYVRSFLEVLKSAVPFLAFLSIYGVNPVVHILPRYEDVSCIHLYNVSAFEYSVLHFQPHKLLSSYHNPVLDVLSALPYLMHYGLPVLYPAFLFLTDRMELITKFYWLMGFSMWAMFLIWKFLPTAPPWMYDNLELYSKTDTTPPPIHLIHREGCAFARLDKLTGVPFFFNMFGGNPVPFASFPSGHVAWPSCIYAVTPPGGRLFALYVMWVAWATLYSCHHYLSDALSAVVIVFLLSRLCNYIVDKVRQRVKPLCNIPAMVCSLNIV